MSSTLSDEAKRLVAADLQRRIDAQRSAASSQYGAMQNAMNTPYGTNSVLPWGALPLEQSGQVIGSNIFPANSTTSPGAIGQILSDLASQLAALQQTSKAQEAIINTLMTAGNNLAKDFCDLDKAIRVLGDIDTMADNKQSNPTVMTPVGFLSFPNFEKPRAVVDGGEERFSGNLIFDEAAQKTEAYAKLKQAIMAAATKFFGEKIPKNLNWPIRDAGEKEGTYAGYEEGRTFIGAWTKTKPGVIGPDKADVVLSDVFAGQLCRFAVRPFAYDKGGNKGVGLSLDGVQIANFDMPRLDGKADAKKLFDELPHDANGTGNDDLPF